MRPTRCDARKAGAPNGAPGSMGLAVCDPAAARYGPS